LQVAYTLFSGNFVAGAATSPAVWASVPLVFGIMTFCYSGHGVFPSIQASMKKPSDFPQVPSI
jgi:vesicular inhibitory amino acid transporter